MKSAPGILIGIALNLYLALGKMFISTILILPIHEHSISFHLSVSSSIFCISVLQFSEYNLLLYILFFLLNCTWIVFLLSLSDSLLYLYRNTTDFCILILYPTIYWIYLLVLIVLVAYLGFSSPENNEFYFFLSNLDSFYYFSCLTAMTRTSDTMLNKGGESGNSCLVPDLRGNTFSFSPLSLIVAAGVPHS